MKRNRNCMSYRVRHWLRGVTFSDISNFVLEALAGVALFAALFVLPHIFH